MTGARYERELVRSFAELGEYAVIRIPSSGSRTSRDLPDVLALRPEDSLAIEVKVTSQTTAYARGEEVDALEAFAERAGAEALIAAKFKRQGKRTPYYLVPPASCRMTDSGNYGVPESDADRRATYEMWPPSGTNPPRFDRQ